MISFIFFLGFSPCAIGSGLRFPRRTACEEEASKDDEEAPKEEEEKEEADNEAARDDEEAPKDEEEAPKEEEEAPKDDEAPNDDGGEGRRRRRGGGEEEAFLREVALVFVIVLISFPFCFIACIASFCCVILFVIHAEIVFASRMSTSSNLSLILSIIRCALIFGFS